MKYEGEKREFVSLDDHHCHSAHTKRIANNPVHLYMSELVPVLHPDVSSSPGDVSHAHILADWNDPDMFELIDDELADPDSTHTEETEIETVNSNPDAHCLHVPEGVIHVEYDKIHEKHNQEYGEGNDQRLTGTHETASIDKFSNGSEDSNGCTLFDWTRLDEQLPGGSTETLYLDNVDEDGVRERVGQRLATGLAIPVLQ